VAAAAVRGGRGSQHALGSANGKDEPGQRPPSAAAEDRNTGLHAGMTGVEQGSGRRPRRPRIATTGAAWTRGRRRRQRPPSAAAEDRNTLEQIEVDARHEGSGRRPRRPRIATS